MYKKTGNNTKLFLLVLVSFCLSSCVKTYKLVPSESYQGKKNKEYKEVVKNNLRGVKVYDQWETDALFDVLWLSDDTRKAYVDLRCEKKGANQEDKTKMLNEELARNQGTVSFYVLADVRDKFNPSLNDKNAAWSIHLDINGTKIMPSSVKVVELDPEILTLFACCHLSPKFKSPYLVTFKTSIPNAPFKMVISSVTRRCELGWLGGCPTLVRFIDGKGIKKGSLKGHENWYWL